MKKHIGLFIIVVGLLSLNLACTTTQKEKPKVVGFAIMAPVQFPGKSTPIEANRTSVIWGNHDKVQGIDFSLIGNFTQKEFNGSALALGFNSTRGKADVIAMQLAGIANLNHGKTSIQGFQIAAGANYSGSSQSVYGFQLAGLANLGMKNKVYGFQVGLYNEAEAIYGLQIGLINRTKSLYGIQIGALNFSSKNGLPVFPVINVGF